jgi:hypothetical protein
MKRMFKTKENEMENKMSVFKQVKKLFKKLGALSDHQINILTGISGDSIRPTRGKLEKLGIIKKTGTRIINERGTKNNLYQYVGKK